MTAPEDEERPTQPESGVTLEERLAMIRAPEEPQSGEQLRAFAILRIHRPWWRRLRSWLRRVFRFR